MLVGRQREGCPDGVAAETVTECDVAAELPAVSSAERSLNARTYIHIRERTRRKKKEKRGYVTEPG